MNEHPSTDTRAAVAAELANYTTAWQQAHMRGTEEPATYPGELLVAGHPQAVEGLGAVSAHEVTRPDFSSVNTAKPVDRWHGEEQHGMSLRELIDATDAMFGQPPRGRHSALSAPLNRSDFGLTHDELRRRLGSTSGDDQSSGGRHRAE